MHEIERPSMGGGTESPPAPPLQALKRDPARRFDEVSAPERDDEEAFSRIRCPLCAWQPHPSSRWRCARVDAPEGFPGGCGTSWNTFSTRGRCPGCQHQWRWTKCLRCDDWSLHEAWYVDPEQPK
jgi:hypothetical protein